MKTLTREFSTAGEFLAFASGGSAIAEPQRVSRETKSKKPGFFEFDGWENALDAAKHGWKAGADKITALSNRISTVAGAKMLRPEYRLETQGMFVDVAEFLTGSPECFWAESEPIEAQGFGRKFTTIDVACSVIWNVSQDEVFMRGSALCALIDLLESAGIRTSVNVVYACGNSSDRKNVFTLSVSVKRADEPLDRDSIAFWLACPDANRRMVFSAYEVDSRTHCLVHDAYGYPMETIASKADLTINRCNHGDPNWRSEASAAAWVVAEAKKQGVVFED